MVLARVANFFTSSEPSSAFAEDVSGGTRLGVGFTAYRKPETMGYQGTEEEVDAEAARPPYIHVRRHATCSRDDRNYSFGG